MTTAKRCGNWPNNPACGLSQNAPYCDGSHSMGRKQETDDTKVYQYDTDLKTVVKEHDA